MGGVVRLTSTSDEIRELADRIDSELIELPKDRNGEYIHVGDTAYTDDGSKAYVERICIMANTTHVKCAFSDGRIIEFQPTELTHTRPDSFERIADDLDDWTAVLADCDVDAAHEFADRIRRLADKEG